MECPWGLWNSDRVELDICLLVANHLKGFYEDEVPQKLESLVKEDHLGVKTGQEFY
ncbi:3-hydroxyacyl-CoA dehydrogenase family protein [Coxiella-like endosymbiont]|uniref:3-hydroxyacyl-CoA dehydrogenase family protein n=1 Tax=Coxiella-like endosymbiont TaxID=1592897 RepID=UPI0034E23019